MTQDTISVVMPVLNRQDQIVNRVDRLLDLIGDLSGDLELIVVDDGSHDATPEILEDLQRMYPQVIAVRSPRTMGPVRAVELAMQHANSSFIFLHESYDPVDVASLRRLWSLRHDSQLVIARATTRVKKIDDSLLKKLTAWGKRLEDQWDAKSWEVPLNQPPTAYPGDKELKMIRREAVEQLSRIDDQQNALEISHLSQRRIARVHSKKEITSPRIVK